MSQLWLSMLTITRKLTMDVISPLLVRIWWDENV